MAGVLVVGSINFDMVIKAPRVPGAGENIHGHGFSMVAGGKGANQAVAASRLGKEAYLLACAGTDAFGDFLVEALDGAGMDSSLVKRSESVTTGVAFIVVEQETGVNTIVVDPGANMAMTIADLDALEPYYEKCDTALFQLEIPLDVVREGALRAARRGLKTILDAGPPRGAEVALARMFDVVSPNLKELEALTGRAITGIESAVASARELTATGIETVVVKMGVEGALLVTGRHATHLQAFDVEAVDSTGAGDAFTAALAVALSEGRELDAAVSFANAAGAAAVTVLGAQPSMPSRADVESILSGGGAS
jgi:ribokinase